MSVSQKWVRIDKNVKAVLQHYRSLDMPTMERIAKTLGTTFHNVQHVIKTSMTTEERKALAMLRYSDSKRGTKNPMLGKTGAAHPSWKGESSDHKGYMTVVKKTGNGREFVHRRKLADLFGMKELPRKLDVHHIDGNGENNDLDNLALVTRAGHRRIHDSQRPETATSRLRRLKLAEAMKYLISPSKRTKAT